MPDPEHSSQGYKHQDSITLGKFDCTPAAQNVLARLAYRRLGAELDDPHAQKLVAQYRNHHSLGDAQVRRLLSVIPVSELYAEFPVRNGQLQLEGVIKVWSGQTLIGNYKVYPATLKGADLTAHLNYN